MRGRSPDVLLGQLRIVLKDLFVSPPLREELENELDGDPSSFDRRLTDKDLRIDNDPVVPFYRKTSR
jgi:hypothetical protein